MDSTATDAGQALHTRGARLLRLPRVAEARGELVWGEIEAHLPFEPKRFWSIMGVPPDQFRGGHAHLTVHELMICLRGACTVSLEDGANRDELVLDEPTFALHVGPLTWCVQSGFTPDALLLVLASEPYRPEGYIRDHAQFLALAVEGDQVRTAARKSEKLE